MTGVSRHLLVVSALVVFALSAASLANADPRPRPYKNAPTAPSQVTVTSTSETTISLSWSPSYDNGGVAGYTVYVSGVSVGDTASTSYVIGGLSCGTSYDIGIAAYDNGGHLSPTTSLVGTTASCSGGTTSPDITAPTAPTQLTVAAATQTTLPLSWTASTDDVGVAGYTIFLSGQQVGTATSNSYVVGGLSCGSSYTVAVAAFDAAGNVSPTASLSATTAACDTVSAGDFVGRSGTDLVLNGAPYTFKGINWFQTNMTVGISNCSSWAGNLEVDQQFATLQAAGIRVVRAWFFQRMVTSRGVRDWSAFDRTLASARAHGLKIIATLVDQWNYCEGPYKAETWYTSGYKSSVLPGDRVPYRNYVSEVVTRYRDDPTIAMWELANEPEIQTSETNSNCPADAESVMESWAGDVSSLIKSIDPNHLVSLGTGGNGNCGLLDSDYAKVYALPSLDVCTYHDYWGATIPLSTDAYNGIQLRIDECNALGKPIYAGEAGIRVQDVSSLVQRASLFSQKINAQMGLGVDGFLAWNWYHDSSEDYEIGPGDPVLSVLGS